MSLSTYSDLTGAVASWLHRSDLTSIIPDLITLGESRVNNELRVRTMETTMSTVMVASVIAVPTGYLELKDAYISSRTPYVSLQRANPNWIYDRYPDRSATDIPAFIAREGSSFIFGPAPDSQYTVTFVYYAKPAALSSAVNSIFTSYPGLYLYATLCEAAPYLQNDKRVALWELKFKELVDKIQKEDDREEWSGSVLAISPG